jgi:hypothetical protein
MEQQSPQGGVMAVTSLADYFREALHGALEHQHLEVRAQTEQYVVNLLTLFARTEHFYEGVPAGPRMPSLTALFAGALEAPSAAERERALQRLGDVSLFVAGFFAHGFAHRLVDIDFHVDMGGRAYGALADALARGRRQALAQVYAELAAKFQPLVDAVAEIGEAAHTHGPSDVLRLYEVWLRTGSARARTLLGQLGIAATPVPVSSH